MHDPDQPMATRWIEAKFDLSELLAALETGEFTDHLRAILT